MLQWPRIDNSTRLQPKHGDYSDWKPAVAEACDHRCVYCAISAARYGGIDNFHVDHFRPKSLRRFGRLRKAIKNLYLSCAICNRFKGCDWPGDPSDDHSKPAYPDPGCTDYNTLFDFDADNFHVYGRFVAAVYVQERLYLNRPQLLRERRIAWLRKELALRNEQLRDLASKLAKPPKEKASQYQKAAKSLVDLFARTTACYERFLTACEEPPYRLEEVRKPPTKKAAVTKKAASPKSRES